MYECIANHIMYSDVCHILSYIHPLSHPSKQEGKLGGVSMETPNNATFDALDVGYVEPSEKRVNIPSLSITNIPNFNNPEMKSRPYPICP